MPSALAGSNGWGAARAGAAPPAFVSAVHTGGLRPISAATSADSPLPERNATAPDADGVFRGVGGPLAAAAVAAGVLRPRRGRAAGRRQRSRAVRPAAAAGDAATQEFDVAIVGAGPAGTLLSYLLAERHGKRVCLIDPNASKRWPNNYGVWLDEWESLGARLDLKLDECLRTTWDVTDTYFGGSWDRPVEDLLRIDRRYGQVDRVRLKALLQSGGVTVLEEALDAQAVANNIYAGGGLQHTADGSVLTLSSGRTVRVRSVVDATGSESKLTRRLPAAGDYPDPDPGFQIAYGFECTVDGPMHYAPEAMTLFDYRTDHLSFDPEWEKSASKTPTFMYVMPLGEEPGRLPGQPAANRVFFEETSLVARPALSFEECKKRAFARLKHLGISVRPGSIEEEEFCYIPMGGSLPQPGQRTIAFGGAAAMVHPATGYQLCRMMASSKDVADVLAAELSVAGRSPDAVAAAAYDAIWNPRTRGQRDFAVFGGELLMGFDVASLRGWFNGFFRLEEPLWAGFLAGWPSLPGNENHEEWWTRLSFGVQLLVKIPPQVGLLLVQGILGYTFGYGFSLFRSVTPLFGSPPTYTWSSPDSLYLGDDPAKEEARAMIAKGPPREAA